MKPLSHAVVALSLLAFASTPFAQDEAEAADEGGGWFDSVGDGPTQICTASRSPVACRVPSIRPSQAGLQANQRATASTKVIWKLNAGL